MLLLQNFQRLRALAALAFLCFTLFACKMTHDSRPRSQELPLFNPHRPDFTCTVEADKLPPIDAQADAWLKKAIELEDPSIYVDDRDYKQIVALTRQAAERHHWKAMLNLASLYLEKRDPQYGAQDAIKLVEDAMQLGVPAAFDRMGVYYMNGTGVDSDATKAYSFFQRAAEMGNPQSMTFLGEKLTATWDSPADGFWANIPIGRKMLECAFGQGFGPAAYYLASEYREITRNPTRENNERALKVLHEGVKLGCADCANKLQIEFGEPFDPAKMLPPQIDKSRAQRYGILGDALSFNPNRRFPNLDKILPLPPAKLPPWDGKKESLLKAAMGVNPPPVAPPPSAAAQLKGRHFVAAEFTLRKSEVKTPAVLAPAPAYWRPTAPGQDATVQAALAAIPPGLYLQDEPFERFYQPNGGGRLISDVVWERWDTIRHDHSSVAPRAASGLTRTAQLPLAQSATAKDLCPATGTWQPWVNPDHSLSSIVNQPWRQAWLTAGQPFPQADKDWLLDLPATDLTWHLMDAADAQAS
jgi:uncharacterized protein